ncbi:hypothetical protein GCM10009530_51070 [Microbispora corallina]|uniref:Uncharacterized protein n=1 Tax=Microbispora corallina TaxID=83302 RepID=A0ABQ4G6N9_9ACTN|nr:hypothetical protein [Microbispora corallina]GIH42700.1 hypothetical protein Mco01_57000 [Microbispora corallina]
MYFAQGSASQNGVCLPQGFTVDLAKHPKACDVPGQDVTLTGNDVWSRDPERLIEDPPPMAGPPVYLARPHSCLTKTESVVLVELDEEYWAGRLDKVAAWLGNVALTQSTFRRLAESAVDAVEEPHIRAFDGQELPERVQQALGAPSPRPSSSDWRSASTTWPRPFPDRAREGDAPAAHPGVRPADGHQAILYEGGV